MMRTSVVALALVLLSATLSVASETEVSDENAVINAAIERQFDKHLPYVKRVVVSSKTLPLTRVDTDDWPARAAADYDAKSHSPIKLEITALPKRVRVEDTSSAASSNASDADRDAWRLRVARPGFHSPDIAYVRMDVIKPTTKTGGEGAVLRIQCTVERTPHGWQVVTGTATTRSAEP